MFKEKLPELRKNVVQEIVTALLTNPRQRYDRALHFDGPEAK